MSVDEFWVGPHMGMAVKIDQAFKRDTEENGCI